MFIELVEIKCQQEEVNKLESVLAETSNNLAIADEELEGKLILVVMVQKCEGFLMLAEITRTEKDAVNETVSLENEKNSMDQTLCQEPEFVRYVSFYIGAWLYMHVI